jgi:soluble lytic murein transglycosylase
MHAPRPLRRRFAALFAACALLAAAPPAFAQTNDAALKSAIEAAEAGTFDAARFPGLASHPAYGWVEYAAARRNMDAMSPAQAQAFLARYKGQAVAESFRSDWLASRSRVKDWAGFRAAWVPTVKSATLRCAELNARLATGAVDARWTQDAQAMWRTTGKALPSECDAPFAALAARGGLTPALRWERLEMAAAEWDAGVMRTAANGLPADEAALANDYAAFMQAVHTRALTWPKTPRSRLIASHGLARLGKSVPATAEAQLPQYAQALGFTEEDRGRVLYQIALWTVASYEPDSARRLAAVPASAYDERLHEWRVREALARSDWAAALAAIRRMGDKQRSDSRWTWFEARTAELTGDRAAAQAAYRKAAQKPDFHGFLAADRLDQPYALCPWLPDDGAQAKTAVARDPAIVRAMALYRAGRKSWAQREWDHALSRFDDRQRRLAVGVAQDNGWFDRGVFGLVNVDGKNHPEETRLYHLRFPIHHIDTIRREAARNNLDPAWVAAEIRAESVFDPNARSSANAMGLMQVLPATGAEVARKSGRPWGGAQSLYDPDTNIALGTAYLRQLMDKYGGKPYEVIAAYNAGPAPLNRWKTQRPGMDPDFWIETISYKETRDYVARVLSFSTVYDWRMSNAAGGTGDALRITDRMHGRSGPRKKFSCPLAR